MATDKYSKGTVSIGEKIALFWLSADKDEKIEGILSTAAGCASLVTTLKKVYKSQGDGQMLFIYLAEFSDSEKIKALENYVKNTEPERISRLAFTEGNLFCLVIERSVIRGIKDLETNKSLMRFESPIRELIKKG